MVSEEAPAAGAVIAGNKLSVMGVVEFDRPVALISSQILDNGVHLFHEFNSKRLEVPICLMDSLCMASDSAIGGGKMEYGLSSLLPHRYQVTIVF